VFAVIDSAFALAATGAGFIAWPLRASIGAAAGDRRFPVGEGMSAVRIDKPSAPDGLEDREALPERLGHRDELAQRLARLPPGHPSSPVEADGTPRPPEPGLRCRESPDASPADDADWRPLSDAEYAEHVTKVREALDKARVEGLATDKQYTIDRAREVWSGEREALQDSIIEDLYLRASGVPCDRRAIMAGGLPGAGKSTILEGHAGIDRSQYVSINPDEIKEEMARRDMIPPVDGLSPMEASDLVHEESSHVAKRLARRAQADGKNMIWDITMWSQTSTEWRINALREAGYARIEGIFVDIPAETSVTRAAGRHRQGHDDYRRGEGLGGRFVPAELIRAQADPEWGNRNRKTFEEVKQHFDVWYRFDNSGARPVLAEAGHREEDHDQH
jgi:predicted kinase